MLTNLFEEIVLKSTIAPSSSGQGCRPLKPDTPVRIWEGLFFSFFGLIKMPVEKISIEKAKSNKLFYFVANVVVYRESDGKSLILKRSERETAHPGKYAVPGGKLEWENLDIKKPTRVNGDILDYENSIGDLLKREVFEEAGIEISDELEYINNVAFIRPDGIPVVLVKFAAKYKSGEVKLEEGSFTDYKWVNSEEAKKYDCIKGIKEEIKRTEEIFSK